MSMIDLPFRTQPTPAFDFSKLPDVLQASDTLRIIFLEVRVSAGPVMASSRLNGTCVSTFEMPMGARRLKSAVMLGLQGLEAEMAGYQHEIARRNARPGGRSAASLMTAQGNG